jgi:hypothetical protein
VWLDQDPHKSQLKNKMVKGKMNDRGWANDVSDVCKGSENTRGKTLQNIVTHENGQVQKRPNE